MKDKKIRLKDRQGRVVEVDEGCCYPPDKNGKIIAALGGFSYMDGFPTDEPVTHKPRVWGMSLAGRGILIRL